MEKCYCDKLLTDKPCNVCRLKHDNLNDPLVWMQDAKRIMIEAYDLLEFMGSSSTRTYEYKKVFDDMTMEMKHWINQCKEKGWIR